jgi:hypothetical protein
VYFIQKRFVGNAGRFRTTSTANSKREPIEKKTQILVVDEQL